ncbi:MAG: DNA-3-methyladenine glycosylase I [Deltaproteobacteria bacterium]|nr:DNA-3-methyladenine glycosylase I [Deltaproteobacteria bacterium]
MTDKAAGFEAGLEDGRKRCGWVPPGDRLYTDYHDREWGVPVYSDAVMFEFLVLESAQAGLSWRTVLGKRENYRRAFAGFDPRRVAAFDGRKIEELMADAGLIRNRAKLEAAVNNAARFIKVQEDFESFAGYIWDFAGGAPRVNSWARDQDVPATTALAEALSRDLKQRGFRFLGPIVCYSHMQATGMVNDHITSCFRHAELCGG